ncbi:MAG: sigma-70 family RNA polymerase sigma factor [Sulfobacillus thermotolerans]|nr:sigma-70 family RNA polymerase sigma factor [Sulfobacillus thermotolerans]
MKRQPQTSVEMRKWLQTVVRTKKADYLRQMGRLRQHETLTPNVEDAEGHEQVDSLTSPSAEEAFGEVEIAMLLNILPAREREVMDKLVIEGKREQEIATEMGLSQQTISRIKRHAVSDIRRELERD